jgi:hypothetical protein
MLRTLRWKYAYAKGMKMENQNMEKGRQTHKSLPRSINVLDVYGFFQRLTWFKDGYI